MLRSASAWLFPLGSLWDRLSWLGLEENSKLFVLRNYLAEAGCAAVLFRVWRCYAWVFPSRGIYERSVTHNSLLSILREYDYFVNNRLENPWGLKTRSVSIDQGWCFISGNKNLPNIQLSNRQTIKSNLALYRKYSANCGSTENSKKWLLWPSEMHSM